jgi:hypothetical protein
MGRFRKYGTENSEEPLGDEEPVGDKAQKTIGEKAQEVN